MLLLILWIGLITIIQIFEFTFHYASTYTHVPNATYLFVIIYIPLCFYLYISDATLIPSRTNIYIPLCFYLYNIPSDRWAYANKFTFHYASTYTQWSELHGNGKL